MLKKLSSLSIIFLLFVVPNISALNLNEQQVIHMGDIIYNDCKGKTLAIECFPDIDNKIFQCQPASVDLDSVEKAYAMIAYLNMMFRIHTILHEEIMVCKDGNQIIHRLGGTTNCYYWNGECISNLPTTLNEYNIAATQGDNSPAVAGDNNQINTNDNDVNIEMDEGNGWLVKGTIIAIISFIIAIIGNTLLNKFKSRKKSKAPKK
jgi:hypothetical protein|tara:strand:+ start:369 stop:986 length:618 start_codon:yes stop_codon:yes gene_type:complete